MRKLILPLIAACLVLSACSKGAKDTVIPHDPKEWSKIDDQVKSLPSEERQLFAKYMLRVGIGGAFNGKSIPDGFTVGQAIEDQRKFEADKKAEEDKQAAYQSQVQAQRNAAVEHMNQIVNFAISSMAYSASDPDNGVMDDKEVFSYVVKNNGNKDIAGIKGTAVLTDMFGNDFYTINIELDQPVPANSEQTFEDYESVLNLNDNADSALARASLDKIKVSFTPTMIVYADGTKEEAPAAE